LAFCFSVTFTVCPAGITSVALAIVNRFERICAAATPITRPRRSFSTVVSVACILQLVWYVVPAAHKWFTQLAAAAILVKTLAEINPRYPQVPKEGPERMAEARASLIQELSAPGSGPRSV